MALENTIDVLDTNAFYYILASIIILIFNQYFLAEWLKKKQSKKRIGMWMDFLRSNKSIDKSLTEFEKIGSQNKHIILPNIMGAVVAMLVVFIFLIIISMKEWDKEYLICINLIPYFFIILLMFYVSYIIKENEKIIPSSHLIYSIIRFYYFFIIYSNLLLLLIFNNIFINLLNNIDLSILSYSTLLISIITLINLKKYFSEQVKIAINNKYLNSFPYLQITTNDKEIRGYIQDIFNEKLIILDDGEGLKSVVEWDSISSLRLIKTQIFQSNLDKY